MDFNYPNAMRDRLAPLKVPSITVRPILTTSKKFPVEIHINELSTRTFVCEISIGNGPEIIHWSDTCIPNSQGVVLFIGEVGVGYPDTQIFPKNFINYSQIFPIFHNFS